MLNKEYLVDYCIQHLKDHYSSRTNNYDKCKRDIDYILDALIKDIKNNTQEFTKRVANRFWYDGKRQLRSHDAELSVYKNLLDQLKITLTKKQFKIAERSVNQICRIIDQGPIIDNLGTSLIQDALKAEHCQRNWDNSYIVPEEDVDVLIKVATTMPTKQNRNYYNLIVSTDKELNEKMYSFAADLDNPQTPLRNSQVNANILFIYYWNTEFDSSNNFFTDNHKHNTSIAVGISSGALALAATQLDYRVGFCQCFLGDKVINELKQRNIPIADNAKIEVLVGVGKPNVDYSWNKVIDKKKSKVMMTIQPYIKNISVYRL